MIEYELIIGSTGMVLILFAFLMNQFHKWADTTSWYDGVNTLGGGLLLWYSYLLGSIPFMILNAVWMIVSLRDVFIDVRKKGRIGHRKK